MAICPYSSLLFVTATANEKMDNWISCHVKALDYLGTDWHHRAGSRPTVWSTQELFAYKFLALRTLWSLWASVHRRRSFLKSYVISIVLILIGSLLVLAAAIGVARFPDTMSRRSLRRGRARSR